MKAFVTLDYYDGTRSKAKLMHLDGVNLQQLVFQLMESGVCGFTVTKHDQLEQVVEKMTKDGQ